MAGSYYPSLIAYSTSCQGTCSRQAGRTSAPSHGSTGGAAHDRYSGRHGGQRHADAGPPVALYDPTQPSYPLDAVAPPGEDPVVPPRPHLLAPRAGGGGRGPRAPRARRPPTPPIASRTSWSSSAP